MQGYDSIKVLEFLKMDLHAEAQSLSSIEEITRLLFLSFAGRPRFFLGV